MRVWIWIDVRIGLEVFEGWDFGFWILDLCEDRGFEGLRGCFSEVEWVFVWIDGLLGFEIFGFYVHTDASLEKDEDNVLRKLMEDDGEKVLNTLMTHLDGGYFFLLFLFLLLFSFFFCINC